MKLSELDTSRAADVLCEAGAYALNILTDEELAAELKSKIDSSGELSRLELYTFGVQKISALLPIILKKHRDDVFGILAAVNGCAVKDVAHQNIMATMQQVKELASDKDMIDFFKSCASVETNA
jgi:hypothetical protein